MLAVMMFLPHSPSSLLHLSAVKIYVMEGCHPLLDDLVRNTETAHSWPHSVMPSVLHDLPWGNVSYCRILVPWSSPVTGALSSLLLRPALGATADS